jgi:hypothetical protein
MFLIAVFNAFELLAIFISATIVIFLTLVKFIGFDNPHAVPEEYQPLASV